MKYFACLFSVDQTPSIASYNLALMSAVRLVISLSIDGLESDLLIANQINNNMLTKRDVQSFPLWFLHPFSNESCSPLNIRLPDSG